MIKREKWVIAWIVMAAICTVMMAFGADTSPQAVGSVIMAKLSMMDK